MATVEGLPQQNASRLLLTKFARGGIIYDAEIARKFGEIVLEAQYSRDELLRQQPLIVEDKGAYWRIEGSWNRDRKIEGMGEFFLSVAKYDARVLDVGVWGVFQTPPEIEARIKDHMRQFPSDSPDKSEK